MKMERVFLAIATITYCFIRTLLDLLTFIIKNLSGENESSKEQLPMEQLPFLEISSLNKGDIVLFVNGLNGETAKRPYLGYQKIAPKYWLYFFDIQGTDEIHCIKLTNSTGYEEYPQTSWKVIGHDEGYKIKNHKRRIIGRIIKLHERIAVQNGTGHT
ncbi:hypothetical protein [Paenibacillus sp. Leaf72]|uniref:hypothetical protein n=1 Tax=Paenibacillus sp. Leaf72 TaxID=1736234 RepID=UPI0006F44DEF|nr:hypothetical protein [Paenibacillus sp. Leaf72]KQN96802.1 hypothetical protein ASF12_22275 [Paenibacillus sp. Leaf72]